MLPSNRLKNIKQERNYMLWNFSWFLRGPKVQYVLIGWSTNKLAIGWNFSKIIDVGSKYPRTSDYVNALSSFYESQCQCGESMLFVIHENWPPLAPELFISYIFLYLMSPNLRDKKYKFLSVYWCRRCFNKKDLFTFYILLQKNN